MYRKIKDIYLVYNKEMKREHKLSKPCAIGGQLWVAVSIHQKTPLLQEMKDKDRPPLILD
jgi:hypothetical protein